MEKYFLLLLSIFFLIKAQKNVTNRGVCLKRKKNFFGWMPSSKNKTIASKNVRKLPQCTLNEWKKYTEFKQEKQVLHLLVPSKKCKNRQRTLYFDNPYNFSPNYPEKEKIVETELIFDVDQMFFARLTGAFPKAKTQFLKYNGIYLCYDDSLAQLKILNNYRQNDFYLEKNIKGLLPNQIFTKFLSGLKYSKEFFFESYENLRKKYPDDFNFAPETLYFPEDKELARKKFANYTLSRDNLWLYKPYSSSLGLGINFFKGLNQTKTIYVNEPVKTNSTKKSSKLKAKEINVFENFKSGILTKYIANPLLINGFKFDLRILALITGINPLKIYIYKDGFIKKSSIPFSDDLKNLDNRGIHITNVAANYNKKTYNKTKNLTSINDGLFSISTFVKHLRNQGINWEPIWEQIKNITLKAAISFTNREYSFSEKEKNYLKGKKVFEFLGPDIIIDSNLRPWLLEVNCNPDFDLDNTKSGNASGVLCRQILKDGYNIAGLTRYNTSNFNQSLEDPVYHYKDDLERVVEESICEFERPNGLFERLFPLKNNIDKYKKFIPNTIENEKLWERVKKEY